MSFNKKFFICVVLFFIILIGLHIHLVLNKSPNSDEILLEKINKIELKLDSLSDKKDSVRIVIDSTHVKIIENEKHYQERINTIILNSDSINSEYVSNYIRRYIESHQSYFQ